MSTNERKQTIDTDIERANGPLGHETERFKSDDAAIEDSAKSESRRKKVYIASIVLAIAVATAWFICNSLLYEGTDDAHIDGHIIPLSARINGQVEQVNVIEGQVVHAGDVLAVIDQKSYGIAVYQVLANLASAQATAASSHFYAALTITRAYGGLDSARGAVKNAAAGVAAAERKLQADAAASQQALASATKAESGIVRDEAEAIVAGDQLDLLQAQKNLLQARSDLRNAETAPQQVSVTEANAQVADSEVLQRRAQMEQARLNLSYTIIRSPVTGIVGRRRVEVGQNVSVGEELLDVVPLDDVWITANFKETQLVHIRPGQPVEIKVDAYGRTWKGHVTNLGGAASSVFNLLPPKNATANHVKVVQRVPVRIDFDRPQEEDLNAEGRLKPGLSVEPEVRVRWLPGSANVAAGLGAGNNQNRFAGRTPLDPSTGFGSGSSSRTIHIPIVAPPEACHCRSGLFRRGVNRDLSWRKTKYRPHNEQLDFGAFCGIASGPYQSRRCNFAILGSTHAIHQVLHGEIWSPQEG